MVLTHTGTTCKEDSGAAFGSIAGRIRERKLPFGLGASSMNSSLGSKGALRWIVPIALFLLTFTWAETTQAACQYSYLSQTRPTYVRYKTGYTLAMQSGYYGGRPTVFLWQNNKFVGQYYIPLSLFSGQVVITTRGKFVYETRNGTVRSVWKLLPAVGVCAAGWQIIPAY